MKKAIYRKVRKQPIARGTVKGRKSRGKMGMILVSGKLIGKKVKIIIR